MLNSIETGLSFTSRRKFLFLAGVFAVSPILEACGFQEPEEIGIQNGKIEIIINVNGKSLNVRKRPSLRADIVPWEKTDDNSSHLEKPLDNILINYPKIVLGDDPDHDIPGTGYWIKSEWNVIEGKNKRKETLYISWSRETAGHIISSPREIIQKDKSGKYIHPATGKQISEWIIGEQVLAKS